MISDLHTIIIAFGHHPLFLSSLKVCCVVRTFASIVFVRFTTAWLATQYFKPNTLLSLQQHGKESGKWRCTSETGEWQDTRRTQWKPAASDQRQE